MNRTKPWPPGEDWRQESKAPSRTLARSRWSFSLYSTYFGAIANRLHASGIVRLAAFVIPDFTAHKAPGGSATTRRPYKGAQPDQPSRAVNCQLCRNLPSDPYTVASRRPSAFLSTVTHPLRTSPPRDARPDQPPPAVNCQVCFSSPPNPTVKTSRRPSAFFATTG